MRRAADRPNALRAATAPGKVVFNVVKGRARQNVDEANRLDAT